MDLNLDKFPLGSPVRNEADRWLERINEAVAEQEKECKLVKGIILPLWGKPYMIVYGNMFLDIPVYKSQIIKELVVF
jgi:hypothetical protein